MQGDCHKFEAGKAHSEFQVWIDYRTKTTILKNKRKRNKMGLGRKERKGTRKEKEKEKLVAREGGSVGKVLALIVRTRIQIPV